MSKGRLEAFSDGVFAIVITLLVLELRLPPHLPDARVMGALLALWPRVGAYVLSFLAGGVFWVAHHIMVHAAQHIDRPLLWVNNFFLMFVTLLPFSANVLGSYPHTREAIVLYGLNMMVIEIFLGWLWFTIAANRRLLRPDVPDQLVRMGYRRIAVGLGIYTLGVVLSFVLPLWGSIALYWVAPLSYIFLQTVTDRHIHAPDAS